LHKINNTGSHAHITDKNSFSLPAVPGCKKYLQILGWRLFAAGPEAALGQTSRLLGKHQD
jgi:hypothetical protein